VDPVTTGETVRPDVAVRRNQGRRMDVPAAGQGVQGRRVEPPLTGRRRTAADGALAEAGVVIRPPDSPLVRTVSDHDLESEVIVATSYSDAQLLADHIRATIPVVLDLRKVEPAMVRRLVDFASGLTYALGGSMRKIGQGVILVTPANVNLTRDERRRLKELGYYQAPEEG
jgi:cell division inhibitor SepF